MLVLRRIVAVVCVVAAGFLVWAVINAANSAGGAKTGVAIGYIVGALVLLVLAVLLWRGRGRAVTRG
jgi:multisubunit Na+/H+ antiporter MnhB subunit